MQRQSNAQIIKYVDFNINTKFVRFDLDNPDASLKKVDVHVTFIAILLRMWSDQTIFMMPLQRPNGIDYYGLSEEWYNQYTQTNRPSTRID